MDADTLAVAPIDDALYGFSNASFAAAPETFPPDTFNRWGSHDYPLLLMMMQWVYGAQPFSRHLR